MRWRCVCYRFYSEMQPDRIDNEFNWRVFPNRIACLTKQTLIYWFYKIPQTNGEIKWELLAKSRIMKWQKNLSKSIQNPVCFMRAYNIHVAHARPPYMNNAPRVLRRVPSIWKLQAAVIRLIRVCSRKQRTHSAYTKTYMHIYIYFTDKHKLSGCTLADVNAHSSVREILAYRTAANYVWKFSWTSRGRVRGRSSGSHQRRVCVAQK